MKTCFVEECNNKATAGRECSTHRYRRRHHGSYDPPPKRSEQRPRLIKGAGLDPLFWDRVRALQAERLAR